MRIVYVITRADHVGGATIHVRDLARAMIESGHEATVLVGGLGPVTEQFTAAGIPFERLRFLERSIHPLRDWRAIGEITAALRRLRPDLVSTHTAKAGWLGRVACARLGLPAIYTPHGWSIGARISPLQGRVFTIAEKTAARWARAIICVCDAERELALRKGIAPAGMLHVVHNGVLDVSPALRADPLREPVRICSVARFEAPKDHATLLTALASIRELSWTMDLVGDGPLEPQVREQAAALGLSERVRFLGYQPEPAATLKDAQIFVLSSRSEGFPRSILEALRAGLPVVASDVGGVRESLEDQVNGLLVPPRNAEALAAALKTLLADPERRARMGSASRLAFENRFRCARMAAKTAAIYATVLGRDPETGSGA